MRWRMGLAAILAALIAFAPTQSWAPTNVAPVGGASAPTTAGGASSGFGKQWFVGPTNQAGVYEFLDDTNIIGIQSPAGNNVQTSTSQDGGVSWTVNNTQTGFAANSFGPMWQLFKTASGKRFVMMQNSTGGFSIALAGLSGGVNQWVIGPAGGGVQTAVAGAQGPNGTIIAARANATVCRSTDDGVSWSCPAVSLLGTVIAGSVFSTVPGTWFLVGQFNSGNTTLWKSVDDGQSWNTFFAPSGGINGVKCITAAGAASVCLMASGGLSTGSIQRSTDGGNTWTNVFTITSTWGTTSHGSAGIADYGGGVVDMIAGQTTGAQSVGARTSDYGVTWAMMPQYQIQPGGTNIIGISGVTTRAGRGVGTNVTVENLNSTIYSPTTLPGNVGIQDRNGRILDLQTNTIGANAAAVFQSDAMTDSRLNPWGMTMVQRHSTVLFNSSTTGAANTAVVATITAAVNQKAHLYSIQAYCSAGTSAATSTVVDNATTVHTFPIAAIPTAPAMLEKRWSPGLTSFANNTAMTITASACGVGNTTTLNVQADRW